MIFTLLRGIGGSNVKIFFLMHIHEANLFSNAFKITNGTSVYDGLFQVKKVAVTHFC